MKSGSDILPPIDDPRWLDLVQSTEVRHVKSLPTKMMLMRLKLIQNDGSTQKAQEAISVAFEFFKKNESILKEDIEILFGSSSSRPGGLS